LKRFEFGANWISYSRNALTKERIESARSDFNDLFDTIPFRGKTFLDIGFGQGLSMLCAREKGANVTGCDIDPKCGEAFALTEKAFGAGKPVTLVTGSILSEATVAALRKKNSRGFDIVHSWGVLHHTGALHVAMETACSLTARNGYLVIAVYNRHWSGPYWKAIKRAYGTVPPFMQRVLVVVSIPVIFCAKLLVTGKNPLRQERGMEFMHDVVDWVGGYPYEYASAEEVQSCFAPRGF
jgi:2-polyprenyl-6-hydroxyphenyl methylase/3-demethylubiquinone-9 3-methyltransferase